jgi:hypothetical protein
LYRVFYSFKKFKEYQEFENLYYEIWCKILRGLLSHKSINILQT